MNTKVVNLILIPCFVGIFFLSGCSSSIMQKKQEPPTERKISDKEKEMSRDRALRHFIEGAALDAKGSFAEAILEYQEAIAHNPNAAIFYAISRNYMLLGKFNRAVETAAEAVRLEPNNIVYRENLGTIYFNLSQIDLAISEYEKVVQIDSNYSAGLFSLARLYQVSKPQKALDIYEKMLDRNNEQLEVLFLSAQLYSSLNRFDEAASKYKRMLELDPSNRALQKQLAETYIKIGRLDNAKEILENMVETDSTDIEVIAALADVYLDMKQFNKSVELYQKLLARGINNIEVKLRIAIGFFGLCEQDSSLVPKTIKLFEELRDENPKDWRPFWYLGAIEANQHKDSIAGKYFEQVIKIDERHSDGWWFFGTSLFGQGKYEQLQEEMLKAQRIFPDDFRFLLLQGLALTRLDKNEDAVEPLKKALKINSKDLNIISTLALTLDGLKRYKESDSLYEEGLKLHPNSSLLLNNYSYSLAERGLQLVRALKMAEQAVTAEPDNAAYLDTYGWVFFKLGKYEDAAKYIEKSVATGKASAVVLEHLGDVYLKLGDKQKALEFWKKALEMDPKNETAKDKILGENN